MVRSRFLFALVATGLGLGPGCSFPYVTSTSHTEVTFHDALAVPAPGPVPVGAMTPNGSASLEGGGSWTPVLRRSSLDGTPSGGTVPLDQGMHGRLGIGVAPRLELGFTANYATGEPRLFSGVVREEVRGGIPGGGIDLRGATGTEGMRVVIAGGFGADRLRWARHVIMDSTTSESGATTSDRQEWDTSGRAMGWRGFVGAAVWVPVDEHLTVEIGSAAQTHAVSYGVLRGTQDCTTWSDGSVDCNGELPPSSDPKLWEEVVLTPYVALTIGDGRASMTCQAYGVLAPGLGYAGGLASSARLAL